MLESIRKNLFLFLLPCLIMGCHVNVQKENQGAKRPNVLLICIDDLRPELGCYGKDYIKSPNIDKLGEAGAVFANHFVQVPTCGASRASMLTGLLPLSPAHLNNEACRKFIAEREESNQPETFIQYLKNNGYYTVGMGKISHSADGFLYGYTDSVGSNKELPNSWDEMLFDAGKWETGWNAFFAYADGSNRQSRNRQVKPYEKGAVGDEGYPDGLTARLALKKLKELKDKDEPFFLGVGFFKPHLPFNAPSKYWDLYEEANIPLSPNPFIPENVNKASLHGSGEFNGYQLGDENASLTGPVSDAYARKLRQAYFACISYVDAQVGKIMDELEELGLDDNTIVVLWGDHGWHLGDQLVWGKHTIFERALKSALIVKVPGITGGKRIENVVSSVDLYPTIVDLCGLKMPHATDGQSLKPLLENRLSESKEYSLGFFNKGISLRTKRFRLTKYFRNELPNVELYDHESDPNETKNIADEKPEVVDSLLPLIGKYDIYGSNFN
jgi:arylsulfatase A-like enzyme